MKTPGNRTIERLFNDYPRSFELFKIARKYIESFGTVKIKAANTQVSFGTKTQFAWAWLPQMWIKKAPPESIVLSFSLGHQVKHPRIKESNEPYPARWMHHVVVEKESDFDDDVRGWLREAYVFSTRRAKKKT